MKNETILYTIIGLLVGTLLGIIITSNVVNDNRTGMMRMMGVRNQTPLNQSIGQDKRILVNIDRHFIEQMIPHHQGAIDMANLAFKMSTHQEIKTLANNIIKSQSEEIEKMRIWYKDWYGTEVPETSSMGMGRGMMRGGMMGEEADIDALRQAEEFDKAFIEQMIPHHQMAVMMANMLENGTNRPEMKGLAEDIIESQTKEISEMREWYKTWGY